MTLIRTIENVNSGKFACQVGFLLAQHSSPVLNIGTSSFVLCCPSCSILIKEPYLLEFHGAKCDHCEVSRLCWAASRMDGVVCVQFMNPFIRKI